ncbi:hypothetical protein [Mucilaginibacter gilvus]|uniref:Uncharacterized protein n=1 Tax=Mucilaginibacter gilvus TaxID=2305909 RepID=A0A3S3X9T4_9SPHI|nr:hypothetical protein [Mucilaginibacter gilvus]RWY53731.1 hypothetical protein EPL05_06585 [Mucilaginibacter gilvus]
MAPNSTKIVSWDKIESRYLNLIEKYGWSLNGMLSLVRFIRSNDLHERLFAYTSLDTLIITIYYPAEWHRETLHIRLDQVTQTWLFQYFPKPYEVVEFERAYPVEQGVEKFANYIKLLKW